MPDLETAEMETPDVDTDAAADSGDATPVVETEADAPEVELDTTEVDTVEIEPVAVDEPVGEEVDEPADEDDVAVAATEDGVDLEAEEAAPQISASPYDMPGDWYVIHSYSGYENKVKANLETRIQSMHMEDRIFEVHIPMEDMVEFKGGKKQTVSKKVFPGYILVRMTLDDDSWYAVRNTPGVTGFVAGNAQKPTPLSRREVERFLGVQEEEEKAKPRFKPEWEVGEQVRVVTGPFADFNGVIEDMNIDQQKIVVLVNIFGRDTPVELGFEDIQKS
jgi:transcription termination/antitermination protein NusG